MKEDKHPLDNLKGSMNYAGCLVTKLIGTGYSIFGIHCDTPADVDLVLSQSYKALEGSLTIKNNGSINSQITENGK